MGYVVAWVLVQAMCLNEKELVCISQIHSSHRDELSCEKLKIKQNKYWLENKVNAEVVCVRSGIPLRLNDK
jgi:hypothetical protein